MMVEVLYEAVALSAVFTGFVAIAVAVSTIQIIAVHEGLPT